MKIYFFLLTPLFIVAKVDAQEFITRWNLASPAATQISFDVLTTGTVTYTWATIPAGATGSGSFSGPTAYITGLPLGATIQLKINPANFKHFKMYGSPSAGNLIDVEQWGVVNWTSMQGAFATCSNLNISASDTPNLSLVTSMNNMFYNCTNLNGPTNIGTWNTGAVQYMSQMFGFATSFNQNIGNWNTDSVLYMQGMFFNAISFNQNMASWNTGSVLDMSAMFGGAASFNQNIGSWNTGNVEDMNNMFIDASSFNQNIGSWNTGNVMDMSSMFQGATSFNQNIGAWNTGAVVNMSNMFKLAGSFNHNIGAWNTGAVLDMTDMFFGATSFNQNIGAWNIGVVQNMSHMFYYASSFNQNLGSWQLHFNVYLGYMLDNCGMNCSNYSSTLTGWSNNPNTPSGRILGAATMYYENNAIPARNFLVNTKGWSISGDMLSTALCSPTSSSLYSTLQNSVHSISPNPTNEQTSMDIQSNTVQEAAIVVFNAFGKKVFQSKVHLHQGNNICFINTNSLPSGIYMIETQMTSNTFINRLVVE